MAKFHINPKTGNPSSCRAEVRCPFGDAEHHYSSKEEARAVYEREQYEQATKAASGFTYSGHELRFNKATSDEDFKRLEPYVEIALTRAPGKTLKVKDKAGYGRGVHTLSYDDEAKTFKFGKSSYLRQETAFESKELSAVLRHAATTLGYSDDEYEIVDWDE